jgi:hypothetical protein
MFFEERGGMIDAQQWLKEFRNKDKTNWETFEFELDDDEFVKTKHAASILGMNVEEYCNYALVKALDGYKCPTCKQLRPDFSQKCSNCGELD